MSEPSGAPSLVPGRGCGSCSMCCKLLAIQFLDPPKPQGQWCRHCKPGQGCGIWQARPQGCVDYFCDWRINAKLTDEWRPDRCGFLINHSAPDLPYEVIVDPGRPDAWRKEPYYSALRRAAAVAVENSQTIVILVGARRWLLLPEDDVPVPPEHFGSDFHIYRDADIPGGKWRVEFRAQAKAS